MKLEEILPIAERYKNILEPYCKRIEIAGSVRRKKPDCGDIELVIIRNPDKLEELKSIVGEWKRIRGDITGRYTQRMLPKGIKLEGIKLDIFIAADDGTNWGNIFLIRTGNWVFSRFMMGIRAPQVGLKHRDGYLWLGEHIKYNCHEEQDVFDRLGMDYIEPEEREWK